LNPFKSTNNNATLRTSDAGTQSVHEKPAVGKVGEAVVLSAMDQSLLGSLSRRDVLGVSEQLRHLTAFVPKRNEARTEHPGTAIDDARVLELADATLTGLCEQIRDPLLVPRRHMVRVGLTDNVLGIQVAGLARAFGVDAEKSPFPVDLVDAYRGTVDQRTQTQLARAQDVLRLAPLELRLGAARECAHQGFDKGRVRQRCPVRGADQSDGDIVRVHQPAPHEALGAQGQEQFVVGEFVTDTRRDAEAALVENQLARAAAQTQVHRAVQLPVARQSDHIGAIVVEAIELSEKHVVDTHGIAQQQHQRVEILVADHR
jgi:hypothetical protein